MKSISVEDWDSGIQVVVPLDPLKPATEVANNIYKLARKQRRAVEQVGTGRRIQPGFLGHRLDIISSESMHWYEFCRWPP
jgi:hypothetical protein